MTLLGRVFTSLIFVLSIVFFSISVMVNASHINQRKLAEDRKKEADAANLEKNQLQTKLENLKQELAIEQMARRTALASLQSQLTAINKSLSDKEIELRDLLGTHNKVAADVVATGEQLKARLEENDLLRNQLVDARGNRDQLFQRLVSTKDQFNRLQGEYERLTERYADLNNNYNLAATQMQSLGIKPDTELGPPKVNGQVTAVASDGTVEVNLGQDDGIRENHVLEVHRNGNYLGRVKVTKVTPNRSLAQILASYQKGYIQAGDRVDSKLY